MVHPADVVVDSIERTGSIACVGLDPRPGLIPPQLREQRGAPDGVERVAHAFIEFNRRIIDEVAGRCAAVKPQVACYEVYGPAGWRALESTVSHARDAGIPVIIDAKRGDIGSTAQHYGEAFFGGAPLLDETPSGAAATGTGLGGTWLTVNGYLGSDGFLPMLTGDGGLFVLVKTSNPGGGELQSLRLTDGRTVAEAMADMVSDAGANHIGASGLSAIGAVVGATYPAEARMLRERMPEQLFLVPGYGAQGAGAADALAGCRSDGTGLLVNSSRGIIGAWQNSGTHDWGGAAGQALDAMNNDLNSAR